MELLGSIVTWGRVVPGLWAEGWLPWLQLVLRMFFNEKMLGMKNPPHFLSTTGPLSIRARAVHEIVAQGRPGASGIFIRRLRWTLEDVALQGQILQGQLREALEHLGAVAFAFLFVYLFAFLLCLPVFANCTPSRRRRGPLCGDGEAGTRVPRTRAPGAWLWSRFSCFRLVRVSVQLFWVPKCISCGEAKLRLGMNLSLDEFIFGCWVYYFCSKKGKSSTANFSLLKTKGNNSFI